MYNNYYKLPVVMQHVACSIEGYRIKRRRFNSRFKNILKVVEERYQKQKDSLENIRDARLRSFVKYAAENVPYYREYFKNYSIDPEQVQTLEDLEQLPIIDKSIVQNNEKQFISETISPQKYHISRTSGTTGAGLKIAISNDASREAWAVITRFRRWHGLENHKWSAHFGGKQIVASEQKKPPYWRYNYPGRQIIFSGYHINDATVFSYVKELLKSKVPWVHGYPSLISLVAKCIVENAIDMKGIVRWVTVGSENLLQNQIKTINAAFNINPLQQYGLTELVAHFSQCESGMLHVDEDFSGVEFIPSDDDGGYRIIGTNFSNPAMPLIRYDTGDIAILKNGCNCGRPGRVVERVDGREDDYIILSDGTKHGRTASIFTYMNNIREAQLYQKEPGYLTVRIVPSNYYTNEDERILKAKLVERFCDKLSFNFEYVTKLKRTKNGKLRFVISEIQKGKIQEIE